MRLSGLSTLGASLAAFAGIAIIVGDAAMGSDVGGV
jgi:hypothetical protein